MGGGGCVCVCVWKLSIFDAISSVRNFVAVAFVFWVGKLRQLGQSRNTQGKQKAVQMTVIPPLPKKRKTKTKKKHIRNVWVLASLGDRVCLFVCCCLGILISNPVPDCTVMSMTSFHNKKKKEARQQLGTKMFIKNETFFFFFFNVF